MERQPLLYHTITFLLLSQNEEYSTLFKHHSISFQLFDNGVTSLRLHPLSYCQIMERMRTAIQRGKQTINLSHTLNLKI